MITVVSIYALNTMLLFVQEHKKILKRCALIFFLLMIAFTGHNYDFKAYEAVFQGQIGSFREAVGMLCFFRVMRSFGITNYRIVLVIIGGFVWFVFNRWSKYTKNIHYVIYLYMLFIAFYDIVQIRNTIIAFLTVYSLLLFLQGRNKIIALFPCFIAPMFHIMAAFTVIFVIYIFWKNPRKDYGLSRTETLIFIATGIVASFGKGIINYLILFIPQLRKAEIYMTDGLDLKSFIIWLGGSSIQIFALWNYGVRHVLWRGNNITSIKTKRAVNLLFRLALFSIPMTGITLWMDEVVRIFRLFFLVMFFLYAVMRDELNRRNRQIIFGTLSAVNMIYMMAWIVRGINVDAYWG